jgi:hypothetical protein
MSKSAKSVAFKVPPSKLAPSADAWIANRDTPAADREGGVTPFRTADAKPEAAPKEKMTRFTFDIPESLHRRVKLESVSRGQTMAEIVRTFLESEFPVKQ